MLLSGYMLSIKRPIALSVFFLSFAAHNAIRLYVDVSDIPPIYDVSHAFRFIYGATVYFTTREILYKYKRDNRYLCY